jgi:glycosyltransferase involved in cell wall biosynthesis
LCAMKILMLNYEFPPIGGGGGQAHQSLLQQYAGRPGLEVDVLTSAPQPEFFTEPFANNIVIYRVGIHKKDLHLWRRREVIEWLRKAGPCYRNLLGMGEYDLVHAFFGFPTGWLCYRTARDLPYIVSLRGSDVPGANARLQLEYKLLGPWVFKPIWKGASALVACSQGLKTRALQFLPSADIDVIPNGIDLERFAPAPEPSAPEGARPLRLLTVGRLSTTKRLPLLIDAVERLGREDCRVHLTIVGGGALEGEFRRSLDEKDLHGAVTLVGRRGAEQMPEIYRSHDVFVSASAQEGMSNAMLEAMASGLPIVTTRCEGVDELIADNGIVVEAPDPAELARAIRALADNPTKRKSMAVAARTRAALFSWSGAADQYLEQYRKVLER